MPEINQAALLTRFEPILRFTQGERFFPYNVEDYVQRSSLWVKRPKLPPEEVFPEVALNLGVLSAFQPEGVRNVYYLQFISPMDLAELAEYRFNELREALRKREFNATRSRLARVGYLSRIADAAFSLMLLLRGRVPGDAMAAAVITFNQMLAEKKSFQYYGRVIQQSGWIILQYWYFYPFNNWRSSFYGANDHEADWEMVNIYCYENERGEIKPAWVGYASHNYAGDDLRRHWDDPEVEKVGDHPVVYVGGGSHASYFQNGEYLTELSLPFLKPLRTTKKRMDAIFGAFFNENEALEDEESEKQHVFTIPFVDYALGDGLSIGFGCEESWAPPVVIEPPPDWVMNFRGLWGYYAQDPFSGEDAPAGPRYNRDGTVRMAWFDPLGWAGLEKVIPPIRTKAMLATRKADLRENINALKNEIGHLQEIHYRRGVDLVAVRDVPHLQGEVVELTQTLEEERQELAKKRRQLTVEEAKLEAIAQHADRIEKGRPMTLRAHIRHAHQPQEKKVLRFGRLAEVWAAISIGLLMIVAVLITIFARPFLILGLGGLFLAMITIEAAFRRRLANLMRSTSLLLALAGVLVLVYQFFGYILLVIAMIVGFYMMISNLRELFSRQ
jgi:hypothetical protein